MSKELVLVATQLPARARDAQQPPDMVIDAGSGAEYAWDEFLMCRTLVGRRRTIDFEAEMRKLMLAPTKFNSFLYKLGTVDSDVKRFISGGEAPTRI